MKTSVEVAQITEENIFVKPYTRIEEVIDKRRRNLEKRKIRLQQYDEDQRNGKKLTEEQLEARSKIGEVKTQLEFIRDVLKTIAILKRDYHRSKKQRDEMMRRKQIDTERDRIAHLLYYQDLLNVMSKDSIKSAFDDGTDGAIKLSEEEQTIVESIHSSFCPSNEAEKHSDWVATTQRCAARVHAVLAGTKEKILDKQTGVNVKQLMERITGCQFVESMMARQILAKSDEEEHTCDTLESTMEDPKVVFVHGDEESSAGREKTEDLESGAEFGFESYSVKPEIAARDPPPPIPLPSENVSEKEPILTANCDENSSEASPNENLWDSLTETEAKPETASEKHGEMTVNAVGFDDHHNRPPRNNKRNKHPRGGIRYKNVTINGCDNAWEPTAEQTNRAPKFTSKDCREHTAARSTRGARGHGRGNKFTRGGARSYGNAATDYANGYSNAYENNYTRMFGYCVPPAPRQAGFNFATGPVRVTDARR